MNTSGAISLGSTGIKTRKLPDRFYKTYQIAQPLDTHFRRATCEEVGCEAYEKGWTYRKSDLIAGGLYEIVTKAGKRYRETRLDDSAEVYVVFEPGQACFQAAKHKVSLEREQLFFAGRGAGALYSSRKANQFANGEEWADSFAHHQDIISQVFEEGI